VNFCAVPPPRQSLGFRICRAVQRRLRWNPQKEQFAGDEEANMLLSRPRRKGYELPNI
jgi:hypothetical protein